MGYNIIFLFELLTFVLSQSTSTQNPLSGGAGSVPTLMAPQLALAPSFEPSPLGYPGAQWSQFRVLYTCVSDLKKICNEMFDMFTMMIIHL